MALLGSLAENVSYVAFWKFFFSKKYKQSIGLELECQIDCVKPV